MEPESPIPELDLLHLPGRSCSACLMAFPLKPPAMKQAQEFAKLIAVDWAALQGLDWAAAAGESNNSTEKGLR